MRLLKQYRERLTGIGDVHYLEEVAFLIQTFETPVFEKLLRNMGTTAHTSTIKTVPVHVKPDILHHSEGKNGKVINSASVHNGVVYSEKDGKRVLVSSNNSATSVSMGPAGQTAKQQLSERLPVSAQLISNGVPTTGRETSVVPPSYSFYLTSDNSQLSNTDSWGSIDLPMGDEKRLPEYDLQNLGGAASSSFMKFPVNNSPAVLSPVSQVPSSNKSSSSSMSVKSVVTASDSIKGHPSETTLVTSSSSQDVPVAKAAVKKEQHITVSLHKGKEGLGFSVVGLATEHKGDLGIYIQDIQKGGLAEK